MLENTFYLVTYNFWHCKMDHVFISSQQPFGHHDLLLWSGVVLACFSHTKKIRIITYTLCLQSGNSILHLLSSVAFCSRSRFRSTPGALCEHGIYQKAGCNSDGSKSSMANIRAATWSFARSVQWLHNPNSGKMKVKLVTPMIFF